MKVSELRDALAGLPDNFSVRVIADIVDADEDVWALNFEVDTCSVDTDDETITLRKDLTQRSDR